MEENRPFMPPPPPHLRQTPQKSEAAEKETLAETHENALEIDALRGSNLTQGKDFNEEMEQSRKSGLREDENAEKEERTKKKAIHLNWNVIINWCGLVVSFGLVVLFLIFLLK